MNDILIPEALNHRVRTRMGYLIRQTSPADGRCRLLRLTEMGEEKVAAFHAVLGETSRFYTDCLSEEEQVQLRDLLARIIANLESEVNNT